MRKGEDFRILSGVGCVKSNKTLLTGRTTFIYTLASLLFVVVVGTRDSPENLRVPVRGRAHQPPPRTNFKPSKHQHHHLAPPYR